MVYSSSRKHITELQSVACHMRSHTLIRNIDMPLSSNYY